jgi:undecaprenyl pyrophosphate phosphatase UppP
MNIFDYILLGVLQGFTEWLPVSSEGVITLFSKLVYGQTLERSLGLAVWLHTGTLAAAAAYFRGDLLKMVKPIFGKRRGQATNVLHCSCHCGQRFNCSPNVSVSEKPFNP